MDSTLTLEAEAISTTGPGATTTRTSGSTAPLSYNKLDRISFQAIADEHPDVVIPLEQTPDWIGVATLQPAATEPLEHGWYEREIVVDLTAAESEIFSRFGSNARNRIGRAQRNGVEIRHIPKEEWKEIFATQLLLLREAFKILKASGNTACGLTGIESENYPSLANVTAFKKNFSKNIVTVATTYDMPLSRQRYALVASLLHARRTAPTLVRVAVGSAAALAAGGGSTLKR